MTHVESRKQRKSWQKLHSSNKKYASHMTSVQVDFVTSSKRTGILSGIAQELSVMLSISSQHLSSWQLRMFSRSKSTQHKKTNSNSATNNCYKPRLCSQGSIGACPQKYAGISWGSTGFLVDCEYFDMILCGRRQVCKMVAIFTSAMCAGQVNGWDRAACLCHRYDWGSRTVLVKMCPAYS